MQSLEMMCGVVKEDVKGELKKELITLV